MSARSLRSGIIKTGDEIQRATRRNTILFKTENGFQQARQIDRRPMLNLMLPNCSPAKRKRKESPPKKKTVTQLEKKENETIHVDKARKNPEAKKEAENETNCLKNTDQDEETPKEISMKRTPRIASLNAIVKVNAVLDSYLRVENKKKIDTDVNTKMVVNKSIDKHGYASKGKNLSAERNEGKDRPADLTRKNDAMTKCGDNAKQKNKELSGDNNSSNKRNISGVGKEANKEKDTLRRIKDAKDNKTFEMDISVSKKDILTKRPGKELTKEKYTKVNSKINNKSKKIVENDNMKKDKGILRKDSVKVERSDSETISRTTSKKDLTRIKKDSLAKGGKGKKEGNTHQIGRLSTKKIYPKATNTANEKGYPRSSNRVPVTNISKGPKVFTTSKRRDIVKNEVFDDDVSEVSDSESVPYDMSSPESVNKDDIISKEMADQAVQTIVNHKSMQTDIKHLPNLNNKQLCTCKIESESTPAISHYNPTNQEYLVKPPFLVKSTVLAHTNNHTLVVPIKKRHVLKEKENEYEKTSITKNISTLIDACINNTLLQNNNTCSKLVYLSNYKEKNTHSTLNTDTKKDNSKSTKSARLQVPQINFTAIQDQKSNAIEKNSSKGTLAVSSKQKNKSPPGRKKKCNGWQFEGEPKEETYNLGTQIIIRMYYESVYRNKEVLHIHDAVLLKSGLGKGHADYVARISMFWEDLSGPHVGDMMMSIYWYYKPDQTNFKFPDTSEMEVYASRHRDDNSVACIVEKCYVISFTQFCRFQAQKMLLKEKCKKKLKVVPENKNIQSRFLPSPDVDESIVYFCRYGYEYRCGKLIKGL